MLPSEYNLADAVKCLDIGRARLIAGNTAFPLTDFVSPDNVVKSDCMHRLMSCDIEGSKELTFCMRGILLDYTLPPYSKKYLMRDANKLGNLRQRVVISACDSLQFQSELVAIQRITVLLDRFFPPNTLEAWTPSHYNDFAAVDFSNKLFLPAKKSVRTPEVTTIPTFVDPKGFLTDLAGDSWLYTADNDVKYLQYLADPPTSIAPLSFRAGDIVQIDFSINVLSAGVKRKNRVAFTLRSITLLDSTFSMELSFRSLCHAASSRLLSSSTVPKRVRDNDTQESDVDRVGKIMRTCHVSDASTAQVAADTDYP